MIQLDENDDVGRERLKSLFQDHLAKLEEERAKKVLRTTIFNSSATLLQFSFFNFGFALLS